MSSKIEFIQSYVLDRCDELGVQKARVVLDGKTSDEIDAYFLQMLVQTRYFGTVEIVWVYGCADKT
jgi:hypothetical protein